MKRVAAEKSADLPTTLWDENFYDLMTKSSYSVTPNKRKRRTGRLSSTSLSCVKRRSNERSQEGSIHWSSSDDEHQNTKQQQIINNNSMPGNPGSPVMCTPSCKRMDNSPTNDTDFSKLICAGSPVLSQYRVSTVKKRAQQPSLLPLSPITPGYPCYSGSPLVNLSHLSVHVHQQSKSHSGLDETPLAVPLDDSENDGMIEELNETFSLPVEDEDSIEILTSQTTETESDTILSEDQITISCKSSPICSSSMQKKQTTTSGVKGSSWIESVINKIEEVDSAKPCSSLMTLTNFDSAKKKKFKPNGLAEQLSRIQRHEKSQLNLFKHQLKEPGFRHNSCVKLQALSDHKEGFLHVMECKVLNKGKDVTDLSDFYTVILQHHLVTEYNLTLSSVFTICSPWKSIHVEELKFPVLLCIYHLKLPTATSTQSPCISASVSQNSLKEDSVGSQVPIQPSNKQACESLLEALEASEERSGISLAATVQRVYQRPNKSKFHLLCEDAFGVFFELEVGAGLLFEQSWSSLVKQGEGQRVYFNNLDLVGRVTRLQCPQLMSLTDSVWDESGYGLYQVQDSQSQTNSADIHGTPKMLLPPSFCYKLVAKFNHSETVYPRNKSNTTGCSDLNRPAANGSLKTDVLYRPIQLSCLNDILNKQTVYYNTRFSFIVKVLHTRHEEQNNPNDITSCQLVYITDTSMKPSQITCLKNIVPATHAIEDGSVVILKDALVSEVELVLDACSQVIALNDMHTNKSISDNFSHRCTFANYNVEKAICVASINIMDSPDICLNCPIPSFVLLNGVICGSATVRKTTSSCDVPCDASKLKDNQEMSGPDDTLVNVMVQFAFKVRLKLKNETLFKYICELSVGQVINSSSLNGKRIGPLPCFVYSKTTVSLQTVLYAEEVSNPVRCKI
uniref:uncharacterized protein LOC100177741 isoform X2 n=1 Tax=Ciona intestinalis TaxID=7719 RepID=UPI000EF532B8|nr:uncharacterized protein LOC100177741 isoform X2 [Ciona intestinalis]|eukprot:XP_026689655.1 uncharacterized protein LOC100177741 isoform X2 [Ciona intestinalis]